MSEQNPLEERKPLLEIGILIIHALRAAVLALPIIAVLVIIVLAMIGPAIGNIFSNTVNSL